ncbi:MAG: cellulase family glycosylhydrolase [Anaerolineae bacterium]|nr:cellulase family glycosylhydrolase [Anaerolineae bacterium]
MSKLRLFLMLGLCVAGGCLGGCAASQTTPFSVVATPLPASSPTPTTQPTPVPTISLGFLTTPGAPMTSTVAAPALLPAFPPTPFPQAGGLPGRVIPEPFGVNIHFTRPEPGEIELLEALGARFMRMDLFWHLIETEPGRYDFSDYDVLVNTAARSGLRIVFILDYGNDLYGGGGAAHYSEEGRAAFARFAAAAVRRYRNKGIIWEIWNEPNLDKYWHATPDPAQYAEMASTVVSAIRGVDPTAWIVGPATSGFPWEYIAALAEEGVLNRLDAVTVHPYRLDAPESAWGDYVRLRGILDRVSPDRKIPIISGEWGYPSMAQGSAEEDQARYLTRQWLFHVASDVDLSIWYDWRNDGIDPNEVEHNFGIVTYAFEPKAAYHAAQALMTTLDGYTFQRRIPLEVSEDYLLLFRNDTQVALAGWSTVTTHTVTLPFDCDTVTVTEMLGEAQRVAVPSTGLELTLDSSPRYVALCDSEQVLRLGLWRPAESIAIFPDGEGRVLFEVENPFHESLQGELQVMAEGKLLGAEWVLVGPGEAVKISVPVTLPAGSAEILPAAATFVTPDGLPLQSALIWLHRVGE